MNCCSRPSSVRLIRSNLRGWDLAAKPAAFCAGQPCSRAIPADAQMRWGRQWVCCKPNGEVMLVRCVGFIERSEARCTPGSSPCGSPVSPPWDGMTAQAGHDDTSSPTSSYTGALRRKGRGRFATRPRRSWGRGTEPLNLGASAFRHGTNSLVPEPFSRSGEVQADTATQRSFAQWRVRMGQ